MDSLMDAHQYSGASAAFSLAPSRRIGAFVLAGAGATLVLAAMLPLAGWLRLAAISWCLAVAMAALARNAREREVRVDGPSIVVDGVPGEVVAGSFVAPWLTIVRWRPSGARLSRALVVMPDALDADRFRALRVILLWP